MDYLSFAVLGLGAGALFASIGTGVVVVYRGTGIINFATSAIAVWGVFVTDELRKTGDLVFPVVGIPDRVHLPIADNTALAVGMGVLSVAIIAALIGIVLARTLATAPILARVVVSLGLMITFMGLAPLKFGTAARVPAPILPTDPLDIGSLPVGADRLLVATVALVVGAALWAWSRWTLTGLAVSAVAENEQAASFAGFSPVRLGVITWVLGLSTTAFVLILASPTTNLASSSYTLMIVPALAIALLGKLKSIPTTIAAGLALGSLQSCLTFAKSQDWFPEWARQGINDAVPFALVVLVLFMLGRMIPARGSARTDPLPPVVIPQVTVRKVALLTALGFVALVVTSGSYRFGVITSMIAILISASLVLLTGMVGQISVAQAAFAGASGFVLSLIGTSIPFPLSLLLAASAASVLGVLVGVPALRIRGQQLAVVTLAAAVAIEQLVFRNPEISPLAGNVVPAPSLFGFDLSVRDGRTTATLEFGVVVLVIVVLVLVALANIMRSATGRRFLAVRENERAGASLGVDVSMVKVVAFAASSFVAGIGGALIGYSREQLSPDSFGVFVGLSMLAFAYLGGITSLSGAFLAGVFAPLGLGFVVSDRVIGPHVSAFDEYYAMLGGVALVVTAIQNPIGIAGAIRKKRAEKRAKKAARTRPAPEETPATAEESTPSVTAVQRHIVVPEIPLAVTGVSVQYGGLRAVDSVDLSVRKGQIIGLIGPNGAGKTTLIDAITGYVDCEGHVSTGGRDVSTLPPHRRAAEGIVRTWQSVELFEELTVAQNAMVGAERGDVLRSVLSDIVRPSRVRGADEADWALQVMGLSDLADRHPSELSLGQQKLLGVARALAMTPSVLLLDEPAAGLDTAESKAFGARLRAITDTGIGLLIVDHDMGLILDVCDEVCVMSVGSVLAYGQPADVRCDPQVVEAYLGEPMVAGS